MSVVKLLGKIAYPFATHILAPDCCDTGKYSYKTISYSGYHELAYLFPNHFTPDINKVKKYLNVDKPYYILRFAKLHAYHDSGIKGINSTIAKKLIKILEVNGNIFITSEIKLESELEQYRIKINPIDMHHVIAFAQLFIGDSQTMAAEAGVLGTPFVRFNDFVGRIGYLDELENKYKLGYGIKTNNVNKLYRTVKKIVEAPNFKDIYQERRNHMLSDKIDVTQFITWFIENYPGSVKIIKDNPDYQMRFKIE